MATSPASKSNPRICEAVVAKRERIVQRFKNLGYGYVTLDLAGFRSGSMNEGLPATSPAQPSIIQLQ